MSISEKRLARDTTTLSGRVKVPCRIAVALFGALMILPSLVTSASAQSAAPADPSHASPNGVFSSDVNTSGGVTPTKAHPLNINSASEAELAALPGVGGTLAKAIVAGRPYQTTDELVQRKIVPETAYSAMKSHILARLGD